MLRRNEIEDVLNRIGVPAGSKGFKYIVDAVLILDKDPDISITKGLYQEIASKSGTTRTGVEHCIRHALENARSKKANYEEVEHYLGFMHCSNGNSLKKLHMMIKRDGATDSQVSGETVVNTKEIRKIVREELRAILRGGIA